MLKTKTKVTIGFIAVLSIAAGVQTSNIVANQVNAANDCETTSGSCGTTFQVNVVESLTVSLTTPETAASGAMNTFLRDTVGLEVTSNNANGFTASMYSNTNTESGAKATDLINSSDNSSTIETMSDATVTKSNFKSDTWGYSLSDYASAQDSTSTSDTTAGNDNSTYKKMISDSASPSTILYSNAAASKSQDIYFGAKASAVKPSGTYSGSVVISVVSGVVDNNNPATPTNPATDNSNTGTATYTSGTGVGSSTYADGTAYSGTTAYTTTSSGEDTKTTTTTITGGDTTSSYPLGVTEDTSAHINSGAPLAAGLAVTSAVAAVSGLFFFILAKRKKDDEDEEEA